MINEKGSQKRCGGIGDILSGLTGLYSYWGLESGQEDGILQGMMLASLITKRASFLAFEEHYYSLTAPKIIDKIGIAFKNFHKANL